MEFRMLILYGLLLMKNGRCPQLRDWTLHGAFAMARPAQTAIAECRRIISVERLALARPALRTMD